MASSQPIVRQFSYFSLLPQILIIGIFYFICYMIGVYNPLSDALIIFLIISIVLKFLIPIHHRKGVRLFKKMQYLEAIEEFEKSYVFFKKHIWVDKFRSITLLSSSRISYIEMALANIAFCYSQAGNGNKSREYYQKTLQEFPESKLALSALKMYESAKEIID